MPRIMLEVMFMVNGLDGTDTLQTACDKGAQAVRRLLHELAIPFHEVSHAPVATAAEAAFIKERLPGLGCKSLFLRHGKTCLLVCLPDEKRCDMHALARQLGTGRLSFAGETVLQELLGVLSGAVSPLALVNDTARQVRVFFDREFVGKSVLVHPLVNTRTLSMSFADLSRLLEATGHSPVLFDMP